MRIYLEKQALNYPQTKKILKNFKNCEIIYIKNYKNLFDREFYQVDIKKSIIIAKLNSQAIFETPEWYDDKEKSYFFKTSLNCVFDCKYCYLKWAFKNENIVIFVNYDEIKAQLEKLILSRKKIKEKIFFYSSDYSDILWLNYLTNFCEEFIEFFEKFEWIEMEIRTKSNNIKPLLNLSFVPKNTEIAFSLNPEIVIKNFEFKTSKLKERLDCIKKLQKKWFKIWLRFLPLLPIKDYKKIYRDFLIQIKKEIDFTKINSISIWCLLYTKKDYNKIISKNKDLSILQNLELNYDNFYREKKEIRDEFYKMFKNLDENITICLDKNF